MGLVSRLMALLLLTQGGSSLTGLAHAVPQLGSAFALGHSTAALANAMSELQRKRRPASSLQISNICSKCAMRRSGVGILNSMHGGGGGGKQAGPGETGGGRGAGSSGLCSDSDARFRWPWLWFSSRPGTARVSTQTTRLSVSRKRSMELSAGRGKGGGIARQKKEGVSYPTSCGWLQQKSLVGEGRMNEWSGEGDDDEAIDGPVVRHQFGEYRYSMRVMYDGTNYCGWQLQPSEPSIQGLLETVLAQKLQCPVKVVGAGRTDTGVHSRGQGAHFDSSTKIENTSQFEHTFNRMLPSDVKIAGLQEAPRSNLEDEEGREYQWHAIYNAVGKLYIYRFYSGPVMDPLDRHLRHFEYRGIDHEKLLLAARAFEGTHSFAAFANQNTKGKAGKNAVRTIHSINVVDEGDGRYRLEFLLDGALYKMVRNVVGTMLHVAAGKMELEGIQELFEEGTRQRVPMAAPAHGLCLEQVYYEDLPGVGESAEVPKVLLEGGGKRRLPLLDG